MFKSISRHLREGKVVPYQMSRRVYEANPRMVRWELFPEAGHGISYILDTERYKKITNEFIDNCLNS